LMIDDQKNGTQDYVNVEFLFQNLIYLSKLEYFVPSIDRSCVKLSARHIMGRWSEHSVKKFPTKFNLLEIH